VTRIKAKPLGPQLVPRALRDLKRSSIWEQQQEAVAKLREGLPRPHYTPEQLKTPQLPADPAIAVITERVRAEMSWEREPEPAPEQAKLGQIDSEYVDWMEVLSRQVKHEEWIKEFHYRCPDKLSDGDGVSVTEKPDWKTQFLDWHPIAELLPEQEEDSEQATGKKHSGGRPPIPPELVQAAQEEYRRALNEYEHLDDQEAAAAHLKAWFEKSSWSEKAKLPSASSFKRLVVRPVLAGTGD